MNSRCPTTPGRPKNRPVAEDPTAARVHRALAESLQAGEFDGIQGVPGAWALVGVFYDQNGRERAILLTPDKQPLHMTLGLVNYGDTVWREQVRRWTSDC